jgi:hypothetical protein
VKTNRGRAGHWWVRASATGTLREVFSCHKQPYSVQRISHPGTVYSATCCISATKRSFFPVRISQRPWRDRFEFRAAAGAMAVGKGHDHALADYCSRKSLISLE